MAYGFNKKISERYFTFPHCHTAVNSVMLHLLQVSFRDIAETTFILYQHPTSLNELQVKKQKFMDEISSPLALPNSLGLNKHANRKIYIRTNISVSTYIYSYAQIRTWLTAYF